MKDTPNDKRMCEFSPEESDTHVVLLVFFLGGGIFLGLHLRHMEVPKL